MFKLYIDTTDRYLKTVRLLKDSKIVDEISSEEDVVSSISKILQRNKMSVWDVGLFDMNRGPGSFAGLKAGAAITNILNWAVLGKPSSDLILPNYQPSKFD